MNTLLLIDGNAIMHRAFHALPPFKTKDGTPTNVVYGFLTVLLKALSDFKPTHIIVCFDTPAPTFRKKLFEKYQAHRPEVAQDFKVQIPKVKELLDHGGIMHVEKDGFEADDIIGTLAKKIASYKMRVMILSGDKDILQLVNDNVYVITPQIGLTKTQVYDKKKVIQKFGIKKPVQIADLKALMGDQSDNYKGAKGIGPKTAAYLIDRFSSLEDIFNNIGQLNNPRLKEILVKSRDNVFLTKKLSEIATDIDIDIDINKALFKAFKSELKDFLQSLEMYSLVKRVFKEKPKDDNVQDNPNSNSNSQMNLF